MTWFGVIGVVSLGAYFIASLLHYWRRDRQLLGNNDAGISTTRIRLRGLFWGSFYFAMFFGFSTEFPDLEELWGSFGAIVDKGVLWLMGILAIAAAVAGVAQIITGKEIVFGHWRKQVVPWAEQDE